MTIKSQTYQLNNLLSVLTIQFWGSRTRHYTGPEPVPSSHSSHELYRSKIKE